MRTSLTAAWLSSVALLSACDESPGQPIDAAVIDAAIDTAIDAVIDTAIDATSIDANCQARTPGQVGGACVTDANCDTAVGAADGICLRGAIGSVVWPAQGFCITKYDGCTVDTDCGAKSRS